MSARTGLAAHVPCAALCLDMARIPALAKAFKRSYAAWVIDGPCLPGDVRYTLLARISEMEFPPDKCPPAPLVDEMLTWLRSLPDLPGREIDLRHWSVYGVVGGTYEVTDPAALARACIEAAK